MNITSLFNIHSQTDAEGTLQTIRENIEFKGINVWLLIIGTVLASIGLNINSALVLIGAMLVSPLMGPIAGAGIALGIYDLPLLRRALLNAGIMTAISLVASALYFWLTPLGTNQAELMVRTNPSFFDVLIATLGGAALVVSFSHKSRNSITVAGAAIATALMPALCTAGYGIASQNPVFFFGAMYLYVINSVFIGLAAFVLSKYLKLSAANQAETPKRHHIILSIGAVLLLVAPSLWMAYDMVQETSFNNKVDKFVTANLKFRDSRVLQVNKLRKATPQRIEVTIGGAPLSEDLVQHLRELLADQDLQGVELRVFQGGQAASLLPVTATATTAAPVDLPTPQTQIPLSVQSDSASNTVTPAAVSYQTPPPVLSAMQAANLEMSLLFPELEVMSWGDLLLLHTSVYDPRKTYTVFARWKVNTSLSTVARFTTWLRLRTNVANLNLITY